MYFSISTAISMHFLEVDQPISVGGRLSIYVAVIKLSINTEDLTYI